MDSSYGWIPGAVILVCVLIIIILASYIRVYTGPTFFGATVDSEYTELYNGGVKCAYVIGWHKERKCMCMIKRDVLGPTFGNDRSLIAMKPEACESK